ncbi:MULTISPECIES: MFS transporter [unclassified Bradyrhizobium]|uniref:MFS transporter n=1 Tax=unclassified Bradyrhizobium TaxID=2631580 RepID=UPI0028E39123|nr:MULTISPECIES: MFS transporter [unclassified Bradyrhizobium]
MSKVNSRGAKISLVTGHMAGMIDQPALPIWVGILISGFAFEPAQAGGLATLFLAGVVTSSVALSPFFHRLPGRWMPALGFGISALSFYAMIGSNDFAPLAAGHFVAGFATGLALSFTHGTMGRTSNPHRIFAMGGVMLGIFAVLFLGGAPTLIAKFGSPTIFKIFAAVMGVACVSAALLFPSVSANEDVVEDSAGFTKPVWFAITGIMLMALVQAMIFSFLERMGADRGLAPEQIQGVLVVMGLIAITPTLLAAFLEKKISPIAVGIGGALAQGLIAITISCSTGFLPYAAAVAFPFAMLFTHTFIFGHLARIEPTGRAVAATPAMIMSGSAIAPLLGGVLVQTVGYPALGIAALVLDLLALGLYASSRQSAHALRTVGQPSPAS